MAGLLNGISKCQLSQIWHKQNKSQTSFVDHCTLCPITAEQWSNTDGVHCKVNKYLHCDCATDKHLNRN